MEKIKRVNFDKSILNFDLNFEGNEVAIKAGPPESLAGLNIGITTMINSPPHNGEVHHDGEELVYVLAGCLSVQGDSNLEEEMLLNAGDACLIKSGEWHKISIIKPAKILYVTPGPNNEHR